MTRLNSNKAVVACVFAGVLVSLGGCSGSSNQHAGNVGSIRSNPSPAMHTLSQRSSDRANMHARTIDTDLRAMQQDFDHIFHLNRPSRLHNNIKPY